MRIYLYMSAYLALRSVAITAAPHESHKYALPNSQEFISSTSVLVCSSRKTRSVEPQPNASVFQNDFLSRTSPYCIDLLQFGHCIIDPDERRHSASGGK